MPVRPFAPNIDMLMFVRCDMRVRHVWALPHSINRHT